MSALEETVRARLIAHAGISGIIGASGAARYRARMAAPAETRPYIVSTAVSEQTPAQAAGGLGRLHALTMQWDCVADTPLAAKRLAECFTGSSTGPAGGALMTLEGYTDGNWTIRRVYCREAGRDDYDPPQNAGEAGLFRTIVEAEIWAENVQGLPQGD